MSFPCNNCLSDKTSVIDSRYTNAVDIGIRRRRECAVCGSRFTTREVLVEEIVEGPLFISFSGLPVDQQKAVRTLVDALSWTEGEPEPSDGPVLTRRGVEDA